MRGARLRAKRGAWHRKARSPEFDGYGARHPAGAWHRLAIAICLLIAAGCGGEDEAGDTSEPFAATLTIELDPGEGAAARGLELRCSPDGGDVPDPAAACAGLAGESDPFRGPPADAACTEIYGGPARMHITGSVAGQPVDATFTRTDGCQIERYDFVTALLALPPAS